MGKDPGDTEPLAVVEPVKTLRLYRPVLIAPSPFTFPFRDNKVPFYIFLMESFSVSF